MHIILALPDFMMTYPELELQISLLDYKVDVVSEGLDLLLTTSEQLPLGMLAKPIMKCQFLLAASLPYILRNMANPIGLGIVYLASHLLEGEIEKGTLIPLLQGWQLTNHLPLQAVYLRRKHSQCLYRFH